MNVCLSKLLTNKAAIQTQFTFKSHTLEIQISLRDLLAFVGIEHVINYIQDSLLTPSVTIRLTFVCGLDVCQYSLD